jgi:hypothetical protein
MKTHIKTNIKFALKNHPRKTAITTRELIRLGVTREALRSCVRAGWLSRLGTGAYTLLEETISLDGALYTLQKELMLSVHEGGFSALSSKHGVTHNLVQDRVDQLFCSRGERLPSWFQENYGSTCAVYPVSILSQLEGLDLYDSGDFQVSISSVERSILEMLYLVPEVHTLQECYQIMELLVNIRPVKMQLLLEECRSVKITRLFLYMADLANHLWLKRLDLSRVNLGSGVREITKGGHFDKKYNLVIGDVRNQ